MIVNGQALLKAAAIKDMLTAKERNHGVSHGLGEAGYDLRLAQDIVFLPNSPGGPVIKIFAGEVWEELKGRFVIASAVEEFDMPTNLVAVVHDKSTWARKGLSIFNTVIEPGFKGGLTLELVHHGSESLHIPAGAGIAQVIFAELTDRAAYDGKYQNQSTDPVEAIFENGGLNE